MAANLCIDAVLRHLKRTTRNDLSSGTTSYNLQQMTERYKEHLRKFSIIKEIGRDILSQNKFLKII